MPSYKISFQRFSLNSLPYHPWRCQRMFKVYFSLQKRVHVFLLWILKSKSYLHYYIQLSSFNYIYISRQTFTDMFNYMITLTTRVCFIEEAKIGTTLGALFGGLFLGVLLTTVAVVIIYKRAKTHVNKRSVNPIRYILKLCLFLTNVYDWDLFGFFKRRTQRYICW